MRAKTILGLLVGLVVLFSVDGANATGKSYSGPYNAKGNQKISLKNDQHVCVLTRVSGEFAGGGESVVVALDKNTWSLKVASKSESGVAGGAYCFLKNHFMPAPMEAMVAGAITGGSPFKREVSPMATIDFDGDGECMGKSANLGPGGAASILSGIKGEFAG